MALLRYTSMDRCETPPREGVKTFEPHLRVVFFFQVQLLPSPVFVAMFWFCAAPGVMEAALSWLLPRSRTQDPGPTSAWLAAACGSASVGGRLPGNPSAASRRQTGAKDTVCRQWTCQVLVIGAAYHVCYLCSLHNTHMSPERKHTLTLRLSSTAATAATAVHVLGS